jgi:hypothetical protein
MLVVDFMHECELGTWKALFPHGSELVAALDSRYGDLVRSAITC